MNAESSNPVSDSFGRDGQNVLDPLEIRVLAVLAEKESLTPDSYPLSLNALTNGCNQLSGRDPVMALPEDAVHEVLQRLMQKKFVTEVSQAGARVAKYEHRMRVKWSLEQDKLAILTMLMLRGPQTAGEIRARIGRMHEFSAITEIEAGLQFLIDKFPPLVMRAMRAPGTKEPRYIHLLSGLPAEQENLAPAVPARSSAESPRQDRVAQLEDEVARLREEIADLKQQFEIFRKQFD
jgi:uncharacterized protein YceH (UPF0502 family)